MSALYQQSLRQRAPVYDVWSQGSNYNHSPWASTFAAEIALGKRSGYAIERSWYAQPPFNVRAMPRPVGFTAPPCSSSAQSQALAATQCGGCQQQQLTPFSGGYGAPPSDLFAQQYPSQRPTFLAQANYACNLQFQQCMLDDPSQSQACVLGRASCIDAAQMQMS